MKKFLCCMFLASFLAGCGINENFSANKSVVYDNTLPAHEKQALAEAKQLMLRQMDSSALWNAKRSGLQAYKTLSVTTLHDAQAHMAAQILLNAIEKGDAKPTNCVFVPDYALSVKDGKHSYDYLISYECKTVTVYEGGEDVAWLNIEGTPDALQALVKPDAKAAKKAKRKKK